MKPKTTIFHDLKMEIPVKNGEVVRFYGEVKYIICNKPECDIYFADDAMYKVNATLKYMADHLPDAFFQCNKSVIINLHYYREREWNKVTMDDGKIFDLSVRRIAGFMQKKEELPRISPPCKPCYTCGDECSARASFCIRHKRKNC